MFNEIKFDEFLFPEISNKLHPEKAKDNFIHSLTGNVNPSVQSFTPLKVLIIDDDIDSILWINEVLNAFGCETEIALETKVAIKKINSCKADLIILDWMLDKGTGRDLIEASLKTIKKFNSLQERFKLKKTKIITYSGFRGQDLILPKTNYFQHIDHWSKPMKYGDISAKASDLIYEIGK